MGADIHDLKKRIALFFACLFVAAGLAMLPAVQAKAVENLPKVTEADLSSGKINGTNWMSGISGDLYLHQITMPGTHDSGMANVDARDSVLSVIARAMDKYAKTQNLGIDDQLQAGVRVLDLRVTNSDPSVGNPYSGDGGLWICHGQNAAKRFMSFVYYSVIPKEKHTDSEDFLTYDRVMRI